MDFLLCFCTIIYLKIDEIFNYIKYYVINYFYNLNLFDNFFSANKGQIPQECNYKQIAGVLGVVKLLVGPYIIVIKEKKLVGKICGHDIWQLIEIDMISLPKNKLHLNETQVFIYLKS